MNSPAHVYVLEFVSRTPAQCGDLVKIGCTTDPASRHRTLVSEQKAYRYLARTWISARHDNARHTEWRALNWARIHSGGGPHRRSEWFESPRHLTFDDAVAHVGQLVPAETVRHETSRADEDLLTIPEAAYAMSLSANYIRRALNAPAGDVIPRLRVETCGLISIAELRRWVASFPDA